MGTNGASLDELVCICCQDPDDKRSIDHIMQRAIKLYWTRFVRLLMVRMNLSSDDAEDVVQAAFVNASKALLAGNYENDNFRGWLYRIVHNAAIDHIRRRDSATNGSVDDNADSPDLRHMETGILGNNSVDQVIALLSENLDNEQQLRVLPYIVQELPPREIAKVTGIPADEVSRINYCIKQIAIAVFDGAEGMEAALQGSSKVSAPATPEFYTSALQGGEE